MSTRRTTEPIRTLNGVELTLGQALTLRMAFESFVRTLQTSGLGEDTRSKALTAGYLAHAAELRRIIYEVKP